MLQARRCREKAVVCKSGARRCGHMCLSSANQGKAPRSKTCSSRPGRPGFTRCTYNPLPGSGACTGTGTDLRRGLVMPHINLAARMRARDFIVGAAWNGIERAIYTRSAGLHHCSMTDFHWAESLVCPVPRTMPYLANPVTHAKVMLPFPLQPVLFTGLSGRLDEAMS